MTEAKRQQLQEAYALIKANRKREATRILVEFLKQYRDDAEAWWLLANAADSPAKQRQALEQVLRVRPDHAAARRKLEQLGVTGLDSIERKPRIRPLSQMSSAPARQNVVTPQSPFTVDVFADDPSASSAEADDSFAPQSPQFGKPAGDDLFDTPLEGPFAAVTEADDSLDDPFASPPARPVERLHETQTPPESGVDSATSRPVVTPQPLDDDDSPGDPFARMAARMPQQQPERRRGAHLPVIALAVMGLVVVVALGLFAASRVNLFGTVGRTELAGSDLESALVDLELVLTEVNSGAIRGDIIEKGNISIGQTVRARLEDGGLTNHGYKFDGVAGQPVTIELSAVGNAFDPRLRLLGPDGEVIGTNDDIDLRNNNLNSRLQLELPEDGVYTVIVSDVGSDGGDYELVIR